LVGESVDELSLLVGEWPRLRTPQDDHAKRCPFAQQRNAQPGPVAGNLLGVAADVIRIGQDIGNVHGAALRHDSSGEGPAARRNRRGGHDIDHAPRVSITGGELEIRAQRSKNGPHVGIAQPRRGFEQRIEHDLKIEGRAADDLEDLGGGDLLLQRLVQFQRAAVELFLQARESGRAAAL
jgi:hypothetical protein